MVKHSVIIGLFCFFFSALVQAKVTATIDKNPVRMAEAVILTVTLDDDAKRDALDTSPLLKDFMVGNTSTSSQTSIINGSMSRTTSWRVVIIPKHTGEITIPALTVNNQATNPIALVVLKTSDQAAANIQRDVYMQAQVSQQNVYVQQQFALTVKLFFAKQLQRGSLSEPMMEQAEVKQFGKDKESTDIINGKQYRIIERQYLITPKKSGELTLTPPIFNGEVLASNQGRNRFFSFSQTEPVALSAEPITISVKPIPAQATGTWLPSELLTLHDEFQPISDFKVGEPITRTITLTAAGLTEAQLPKITLTMPDAIDIYPDQAENHTRVTNGKLVAQKVQKFALIASQAGTFTLPEVKINWWNTITNKPEVASLPAKTITIAPGKTAKPTSNNNTQAKKDAVPSNGSANTDSQINSLASAPKNVGVATWYQYTTWLFALLWLTTLVLWLMSYNRQTSSAKKSTAKTIANQQAYQQLIQACQQQQTNQILRLIPQWIMQLSEQQYSVTNLQQAKQLLNNQEFNQQLDLLEQSQFAKQQQTWDSAALITIIKQIQQQGIAKPKQSFSLNPTL